MWTARVLFGKAVRFLSQWLSKYREQLGEWMGLSSNTDILLFRLVSLWSSWKINISHGLERFVVDLYTLLLGLSRIWSNSAVLYKTGIIYIHVTSKRFRPTIVAVEINKYYILWLYFYSLSYPACNAHAPYRRLWPVRLYNIFKHYLIKGTIFEKKLLNIKCMFWFSVQDWSEIFSF
jgi:hypothetical protein